MTHLDSAELDKLWDFANPAASEARFRSALNSAPAGNVRDELATQLARALGLQQRWHEADAVLDAIDSADETVSIRIALERGRLRNSSGDAEAIPHFQQAAKRAKRWHGEPAGGCPPHAGDRRSRSRRAMERRRAAGSR